MDTSKVGNRDRARATPHRADPPPVPADVRLAALERNTAALEASASALRASCEQLRATDAAGRAQVEASRAIVAELAALRAELREALQGGRVSAREAAPPASDLVVSPEVEAEVREALEEEMAGAALDAAESGARPPGEGLRVMKERELRADPERRRRARERKAWRANPPAAKATAAPLDSSWKAKTESTAGGWKPTAEAALPVDPEAVERLRAAQERLAALVRGGAAS